jgi:hypothetical protein
MLVSYGEELLAPQLTPKLKEHNLSFAHICLFNILPANSYPGLEEGHTLLAVQNSLFSMYTPLLEVFSSILNPGMCHTVVSRDTLNI